MTIRAVAWDADGTPLETVAVLAEAGLSQICVSNADRGILDRNIEARGLGSLMEFSLSLDDVSEGKPHPEPYALGCDRLRPRPDQIVAYDHLSEEITDADHVIRDLPSLPSLIGAHRSATMPAAMHGTGGA